MAKQSAGILLYNFTTKGELKVLLVHPGGPFWKNKDAGAWSVPKGEYAEGDDAFLAAKREFKEEMGIELPPGNTLPLKPVKMGSGKVVTAWAVQAILDITCIKSNQFEMEWPPRSGKRQSFPEVDRAEWFAIEEAKLKINNSQRSFLNQLAEVI